MVLPIQALDHGCAQTSTYALVRAIRDGTPHIDRYASETCDKSYRDGHFFSNKAPGLAFAVLPVYAALDVTHSRPDSERTLLWILGLWASVVPAVLMLLMIRRIANRFDAETGTLVAVVIGLGTLTLPLATLAFGHILAAALLMAAFAIALDSHGEEDRLWRLTAAGALAGLAITTEYPAGLVAVVIGIYAATTTRALKRLLAFGLGGAVGLIPLLLYNQWAFGSPNSLSYADAVKDVGPGGAVDVGNHDAGFYGVLSPSLSAAMRILVSDRGLLMVTPIMIVCILGVIVLARRGFRAEAVAIGAIAAAMLVYNASLTVSPGWVYGGDSPGPRYLYLGVPFALLPLGLVYRKTPAVVAALATVSFAWMAVATVTQPLVGPERTQAMDPPHPRRHVCRDAANARRTRQRLDLDHAGHPRPRARIRCCRRRSVGRAPFTVLDNAVCDDGRGVGVRHARWSRCRSRNRDDGCADRPGDVDLRLPARRRRDDAAGVAGASTSTGWPGRPRLRGLYAPSPRSGSKTAPASSFSSSSATRWASSVFWSSSCDSTVE